ncbi:MAG: hypothetical protein BWZ10_02286 [candidate division BRC1 bacterium ADurb.BinA364]|nr:MAG: hypothetical protein BWZ10_02286 [candidate division BRC1 bacterium ADurb.BinA364]
MLIGQPGEVFVEAAIVDHRFGKLAGQLPLADQPRLVALGLQDVGERDFMLADIEFRRAALWRVWAADQIVPAGAKRVAPGHQRHARRRTQRHRPAGLEPHAVLGQRVEIGRSMHGIPVTGDFMRAEIVGHHHNEIRRTIGGAGESDSQKHNSHGECDTAFHGSAPYGRCEEPASGGLNAISELQSLPNQMSKGFRGSSESASARMPGNRPVLADKADRARNARCAIMPFQQRRTQERTSGARRAPVAQYRLPFSIRSDQHGPLD